MKPMKLEGALKLYMVLYFLAFLATFMMSVPMLLHVVPLSECLLFVDYSYDQNRKFTYGSPGGEFITTTQIFLSSNNVSCEMIILELQTFKMKKCIYGAQYIFSQDVMQLEYCR